MREYLLVMITGMVVTYVLVPLVRMIAVTIGAQAPVRDRDVHAIPTPRIGGLAMFGGLVGALIMAQSLPKMNKIFAETNTARAVLLAGGLIVLIGIADDKWEIDPLTKFAGQVAAAGILIMNGVQLNSIPTDTYESTTLSPNYGVPLTVLIVVATINAVNFVDGLDGLAAGIVCIAGFALFLCVYRLTSVFKLPVLAGPALIAAILFAICLGFLAHNFNPARIFMGDTGSMLIGLLLAAATIQFTGLFDSAVAKKIAIFSGWLPLLLVPAVLAVPFLDMLLAVWRRTNQGRSPFAPDKHHLHHRLLKLGHSHRSSVMIMYGWVGLLASCMVAISYVPPHSPNYLMLVLSVTFLVALVGAAAMILLPRLAARKSLAEQLAEAQETGPHRPREHV
jgi:UDP-GlcNAc:undecaprenyl-phosphate GlcNAc-1-phosphate transferase